jgi:DNA-binding IclR family transcriptional regulator
VFDGLRVIGSITVSTPLYRFDDSALPDLKVAVRDAAAMVTLLLTADAPPEANVR